jgi:hypothetical protein
MSPALLPLGSQSGYNQFIEQPNMIVVGYPFMVLTSNGQYVQMSTIDNMGPSHRTSMMENINSKSVDSKSQPSLDKSDLNPKSSKIRRGSFI